MPTTAKKMSTLSATKAKEATSLLRADHKLVNDLLDDFEQSRSENKRRELALKICQELTVHAQIEEEIFYPAVKAALKDKELIPEATVEHATLKSLIAEIQSGAQEGGEMFNATVKVLGEYVKHHVKEEQNELFPKLKETNLDLMELGAQLQARKDELTAQITV